MEFRPCIDIHNGKVKQIVGGSLKDEGNMATKILFLDRMQFFMQIFIKKKVFAVVIYFIKCERQRILRSDKETGDGCVTGVSGRSAGWRRHYG